MRSKFLTLLSLFIIWLGLAGIKFTLLPIIFACLVPLLTFYISYKLQGAKRRHGESPKEAWPSSKKKERLDGHAAALLAMTISSITYLLWLIREIILSSIAVSKIIWRKNLGIIPTIAPIISGQKTALGSVIYANSITLTPGTVTLSVEGNKLLVHALDSSFMDDLQEGAMDRRVKHYCDRC